MKLLARFLAVLGMATLLGSPLYAQHSHSSHSSSHSSSRPYYGGGKHTGSHGGHYSGGSGGSSHKGGHYQNPRTNNEYGKHKP
jgi:hypothetical protein